MISPAQRGARLIVMLGWMALITYWSSQGSLPIDRPEVAAALHGFQHRLAHLAAFGLLGLLARWAFDGLPRAAIWAVVLTSVFGAADEWHQTLTPGRRPAIDDWATDTAFAMLAIYVWSRLRATTWRTPLRTLAPMTVAAMFAVGVVLAIGPNLSFLRNPDRPSLRAVPGQVVHAAQNLIRKISPV